MALLSLSLGAVLAISALTSVIASGGTALANYFTNKKTNETNERLTREQNEWNRQQIEDERAFNDPQMALQRLRSAGLNTNLAYGDVNSQLEGAATGSAPTAVSPDFSPLGNITQTTDSVMQSVLQKRLVDIEQQNADTKAKEVDGLLKYQDACIVKFGKDMEFTDQQIAESKMKVDQMGKDIEVMNARIAKYAEETKVLSEEVRIKQAEAYIKEVQSRYSEQYWQSYIKNLDADTQAKLAKAKLDARSVYEMVQTYQLRVAEIMWNVSLKSDQHVLNEQEMSLNAAKKLGLDLQNDKLRVDLNMEEWKFGNEKRDWYRRHLGDGDNYALYNSYNPIGVVLRFINQVIGDFGASISLFGPKL